MHNKWTVIRQDMAKVLSTTTLQEIKKSDNLSFITNTTPIQPDIDMPFTDDNQELMP